MKTRLYRSLGWAILLSVAAMGCKSAEPEGQAALNRRFEKCTKVCRKLADKNRARCSGPSKVACETAVEATYNDCKTPCEKIMMPPGSALPPENDAP